MKIFPSSKEIEQNKGVPEEDQVQFDFSNCTFRVNHYDNFKGWIFGSKRVKEILTDVSASIISGTDLAIMGPSGSGKSTLLNLLTLAPSSGAASGAVTINGHKLSSSRFRQFCAYVPQDDNLCPFLTCREILQFAVDFYLTFSNADRQARTDSLLKDLGLESCQNTKCGNEFLKGLSGGQKRRLSLAVALAKEPLILFLDEPTSGLDSAATAEIIAVLKRIKIEKKIILICTIHQPSTRVFNDFDSILLLSGGKVAYFGPTSNAAKHFRDMGHEMPADLSPSEFLLDLVNCDFGGDDKKQQVNRIIDAWRDRAAPGASGAAQVKAVPRKALPGVSFGRQVLVHTRRQALLSVRDPTLYLGRLAIFMVSCIFFALVYIRTRERNQQVVTDRMFLTGWMFAVPSCMGTIAVFSFNHEFRSLRREIKDGMYSPSAYLLSNALLQLPFMVLLTLAALVIGAYGIAAFEPAGFGRMVLVFSVGIWAFEMIAQALGVLLPNPLAGMPLFIFTWFAAFLFSGLFIVGESIPWPLKAFHYVLPLRWSIAAMVKTEFQYSTYDGALPVPASNSSYTAFVCPQAPPPARQVCFGRTGEQVLWSLSQSFTLFDPADTFGTDVACLAAIGLAFKLLYAAVFVAHTRQAGHPAKAARRSNASGTESFGLDDGSRYAPASRPPDANAGTAGPGDHLVP